MTEQELYNQELKEAMDVISIKDLHDANAD
jgi:hypothetical protein